MGDMGPDSAQSAELMRRFTSFLDADNSQGKYSQRISDMVTGPNASVPEQVNSGPKRLIISIDDLRDFDPVLADDLLYRPVDHLPVLERAMQDLITGYSPELSHNRRRLSDYRVGLDGAFGGRHVSPRGLAARLVGGVVSVEGIVTRASTIRPRLILSVHYCPRTGRFHEKTYRDNASVSSLAAFTQNAGMPGSAYPTKDEEGNPLETEFGKCWYRDTQRITIQEMPEKSPPGQLPRSIDVLIEGDLCDACKPGDRVKITGIYRAIGGSHSAGGSGIFKTFVVSNHIALLGGAEGRTHVDSSVADADIRNVLNFSTVTDPFSRLARSIAPSIFGHEFIKKALLLLLIGGKEQNLANGTHLRGDINVLMVGDPSTAKSQLLRFILHTAPLAVSTTGRGSSGVGLTAAVTTDQDTGDRHLEAGAMVLADRGVVCIDEFDKMSDEDRVAIHEVMEQQTVTIAKAGIHASLNARCSVIAAANPVYGSYDKLKKPHENIALPDSLLSRFDLLFIVLDSSDKDRDRLIADHVLRGHRFRKPTHTLDDLEEADGRGRTTAGATAAEINGTKETPMYEDAASALYRKNNGEGNGRRRSVRNAKKKAKKTGNVHEDDDRILSTDFLKLYINYAKHRCTPTLTPEAAEFIASAYRDLRQDIDSTKTLPITARCLETLIRLATAHAKSRLEKHKVSEEDARVAVTLLKFALFNQAEPDKSEKVFKRRTRRSRKESQKKDDEDTDDDSDDDNEGGAGDTIEDVEEATTPRRSARKKSAPEILPESMEADNEEDAEIVSTPKSKRKGTKKKSIITPRSENGSNGASQASTAPTQKSQPEEGETDAVTPAAMEAGELDGIVDKIKNAMNELRGRKDVLELDAIIEWFKTKDGDKVPEAKVMSGLEKLQTDDVIVISDKTIFIV